MKKISCILLNILLVINLFSCGNNYKVNTWFSIDYLEKYNIKDLPLPTELINTRIEVNNSDNQVFYYTSTFESMNTYAETLINYLLNNDGIYNVSERIGHGGLIAEMFPYDEYKLLESPIMYEESEYTFAFSLTKDLDFIAGYLYSLDNPIRIAITFSSDILLTYGFKYNTTITIFQRNYPSCVIE